MKFIFLDQDITIISPSYLDPLKERGTVEIYNTIPENEEQVVERAREADVIFFATTKITNEILDRLPKLKILQFLGTGVWNLVDMDYAEKKGVTVLNIEGYGNNAVAEYALALAFSLARNIPQAAEKMANREWSLKGLAGVEIQGSTFGVIGTGNIGAVVARKASLLGARVFAFDIFEQEGLKKDYGVQYVSLEKVVTEADFLTLHLKTTPKTRHIMNRNMIMSMKKSAFLINVARADLVDNDALYEALQEKRIRGAALDVFDIEPPKDYRFTDLKNVITSPHMGFYTDKAVITMLTGYVRNVINTMDTLKLWPENT